MFHTFPSGRREPIIERCTLVVEFLDGATVKYADIAYLAVAKSLGYADPIVIDGTTVTVENYDQSITILGVRHFTMEFPNE